MKISLNSSQLEKALTPSDDDILGSFENTIIRKYVDSVGTNQVNVGNILRLMFSFSNEQSQQDGSPKVEVNTLEL